MKNEDWWDDGFNYGGITAGQDNLTPHIYRMKNYQKKLAFQLVF